MKHALVITLLLAGAGSLFSPAAQADATMAFVINDRPAQVPAARVRWSYALAAAPVVGVTSVSITEGANPPVVATYNSGAFVSLASGDRFRLDPAPTLTNGVSFLYEARSHFTPPDFCNLKVGLPGGTFPKSVTLNFTGPQITDHFMATYTVAGVTAATTFFCQQTKRRVNSAAAGVVTPPPAPAPAAASRHPLDVILVLDKSGSMGWELPGSPMNSLPSRWTVLGTALDQFEALWEQASESSVTGDRLGLVHFATTTTPGNFDGGTIFRVRGTNAPGPTHNWNTVLAAAKAPTPGGSTAIGQGLNLALTEWAANPANFDAVVILMTDGEQNVDPEISKIAGTDDWALAAAGAPVANVDELYRKGLPIQTIGFGTPAAVEADLLGGVAEQTAGTSIITATDTGLSNAMQDVLVSALKGNSLGLLSRSSGSVSPPAQFAAPIPLILDASVKRATLVLSWTGRRGLFDVLLQPPGGGTPIVPTVRKDGANWLVTSIDLPQNGTSGEWRALVRGRDLSGPASFNLSAYAVDGRLKYSLNFGRGPAGTGDAIPLLADLSYDGKPLTGIAGGIRLSPAAPNESMGNILHAAGPGPAPAQPDQNPTTAKVLALARDANLLKRTTPQPTGQQLLLNDSGSDGDATAGDGVYTTRVTDTRVPGRYQFDVLLEWDDPRTGKVKRLESVQRSVSAVPVEPQTVVVVQTGSVAGSYQIQVTPRDKFGNYMGPGFGKVVKVTLNGGGTVGPVQDAAQTGDYTVQVSGVPPGVVPTVDIVVDGKPVRTTMPVVPGTTGGGGGSGKYALWFGLGAAVPHGSFGNTHKAGLAATLGFEAVLNPSLSAEATLGSHRFAGKGAAPDVDATVLGLNAKWYFTAQPLRWFATAGVGSYAFNPGSTRFGVSGGAGAQFHVAPQWSVEGRYTLHSVSGNAPNSRHSTVLLGLRYAF